jgi:hypothetical protein
MRDGDEYTDKQEKEWQTERPNEPQMYVFEVIQREKSPTW